MSRSFVLSLAMACLLVSLSPPAFAATPPPSSVVAGSALAADTQKFVQDSKAGASQDVLAKDAAQISSDLDAGISALGVGSISSSSSGKYVFNLNVGAGGSANMAFPSRTGGTSIAGGAGASLIVDLGVGRKTDATDHFHIALSLGVTTLTASVPASEGSPASTSSVGAFTASIMPAWLPVANAPEYGIGPIVACPFVKTQAISKSCIVGVSFTTALAAPIHQFLSS